MQAKPLCPKPYRFLDSIFYSDIMKFSRNSIFLLPGMEIQEQADNLWKYLRNEIYNIYINNNRSSLCLLQLPSFYEFQRERFDS